MAFGGAFLQRGPASQDRYHSHLLVSGFAFLPGAASRQYLLEHILPFGWPYGRSSAGARHPFRRVSAVEVRDPRLDRISGFGAACPFDRNLASEVDRVFRNRA